MSREAILALTSVPKEERQSEERREKCEKKNDYHQRSPARIAATAPPRGISAQVGVTRWTDVGLIPHSAATVGTKRMLSAESAQIFLTRTFVADTRHRWSYDSLHAPKISPHAPDHLNDASAGNTSTRV